MSGIRCAGELITGKFNVESRRAPALGCEANMSDPFIEGWNFSVMAAGLTEKWFIFMFIGLFISILLFTF